MFYFLRKQTWVSIPSSPFPPPPLPCSRGQEMKTISACYTKCVEFMWLIQSCCMSPMKMYWYHHQIFPKLFKNYHLSSPLSIWGGIRLGLGKKKKLTALSRKTGLSGLVLWEFPIRLTYMLPYVAFLLGYLLYPRGQESKADSIDFWLNGQIERQHISGCKICIREWMQGLGILTHPKQV